MGGTARSISD